MRPAAARGGLLPVRLLGCLDFRVCLWCVLTVRIGVWQVEANAEADGESTRQSPILALQYYPHVWIVRRDVQRRLLGAYAGRIVTIHRPSVATLLWTSRLQLLEERGLRM